MHGTSLRRAAAVAGGALLIVALLPASVAAVVAGPATQLVFVTQPSNTATNGTISPAVTVQVEDAGGTLVTTDTSNVTLSISANPGAGTLAGTLVQAASGGVATFNDLKINNPGIGYTLHATDGALTAATSASFTIVGPATKLAFGVQPSNSAANGTISPAVTVLVEDAGGSVISSAASVTLTIGTNPGPGSLTGTLTEAASGGVATFNDLKINNPGIGYTLSAASAGLASATSSSFTIFGSASKLVFGVQPSNTAANGTISPAVTVKVEDAGGSVVTTDGSNVTLAFGTNAATGTLGGTLTQAASGGVATFGNLSINNAGIGYTLQATDGSLTAATSSAFTIIGSPAKLAFGVQPSNAVANATISPAVTVQVDDVNGTVVPSSSASVTLTIQSNPAGGTLAGTLTQAASGGVATFSNLSINNVGTGYTLSAASSGLTGVSSGAFNITGSNYLVFGVQPGGGAAGVAWSQQPVVEVVNSLNQLVTTDNSTLVYLAISTNPAGGTLSCSSGTGVTVINGVATFSGCSINVASPSSYTLGATSSPAATTATSNAFSIGSEQLAFAVQPGGGAAGVAWTQQPVVEVVNSLNQVITTDSSTVVSLAISTNPAGGTLSCASGTGVTVVNGVATFAGCSIDATSSSAYTLGATSSPAWTAATSSGFYVTGPRSLLSMSASSALGLKPVTGFTTRTPKTQAKGKYVTWEFMGGAALAGQRVNILVAKNANGTWTTPGYYKSAWADANGTVTFAWTSKTAMGINVRIQWPGSSTYSVSTSRALGAYWK